MAGDKKGEEIGGEPVQEPTQERGAEVADNPKTLSPEPSAETLVPATGVRLCVVAAAEGVSAEDLGERDCPAKDGEDPLTLDHSGPILPKRAQWHPMPKSEEEARYLLDCLRKDDTLYRIRPDGEAEGPYTVCPAIDFTGKQVPVGQNPIGKNGVGILFHNESLDRHEVCVTVRVPSGGTALFQLMFNPRSPISNIVVDHHLRVVE